MNNILIFSDLHITKQDLTECCIVLQEIGQLCSEHQVDELCILGDVFDGIHPGSEEMDTLSHFIKTINIPIINIIAQSHESETKEISVLNHFGILYPQFKNYKEWTDGSMYLGHFYIKESLKGKYGATISKNDLKKYKKVFLGHSHIFEIIKPNICQIGSSRYVSFDEAISKNKTVALITDYGQTTEKTRFLALKSPYPMLDIVIELTPSSTPQRVTNSGIVEGIYRDIVEVRAKLDSLPPKTKVRLIFKDYEGFKSFLPHYNTYKSKFIKFIDKKDFILDNKINIKTEDNNMEVSLKNYLETNKIDSEITDILLKEIKCI